MKARISKKYIEISISYNFSIKLPKTYIVRRTKNYMVIHNPLVDMPLVVQPE